MWNYLFIVWNIVNARQILRRGQALTGDCESWVSFPDPHKSAFLCPGMTLWFTFSKCEFELKQWRIWVHLNTFLVPAAHCVNLRDMGLSRAQATPDSHPEASSGHAQEAGRARTPRSPEIVAPSRLGLPVPVHLHLGEHSQVRARQWALQSEGPHF